MAASNADEERGELEVRIISAANLAPKDADGKSDPYCRVACIEATRSRKRRTQTKSKELNPRWDERFFFADTAGDARVVIDVWDEDADGVDDLIGKVVIRLDGLARNELVEDTYEMIDGDVRVAVAFRPGVGDAAEDEAGAEDDEPMPLVPGGPDGETARSSQFYKLQQDSPHLLRELEKVAARLSASKGRLFEDEDFSGPRSIYIDPKRVPEDFLGGGTAEIAFLRPAEMPSQPVLFFTEAGDTKDIEPDDINQGQIGDCYLLAAIATIANEEHLIKDLLVEDHAALGVFGVKLFDWMGWHTVVVDSRFPCDARSKRQLFCHSDSGKEFWAACFEKAWAKYHGCYEAIEGGDTADTMAYLTGGRVDHISFDERPDHGSFWEEMLALFAINEGEEEDRCFLCASGARGSRGGKEDPESVPKEDPGGLVSGHAYSVLELREALGHRLIRLRNPWGSFEWQGDWGDNSALWTDETRAAFDYSKSDDGEFWMSWADFMANFSRMGVVVTVPRTSPMLHVTGRWRSGLTAGGEDELLSFNPRYLLSSTERTRAHISLAQPDTRALGGGGFLEMHIRVFVLGADADVHAPLEPEQQLEGAMKTVWHRRATLELEIDPARGQHVVLVSLWAPGWEGDYGLTVTAEAQGAELTLTELAPLRPSGAEAAAMRAKPIGNKCATCAEPCALGRENRHYKHVRWHGLPGCYRCAGSCGAPFEMERSTESFATFAGPGGGRARPTAPPRPIFDVHEHEGGVHGFCKECYRERFAPRCMHCAEPVDEGRYYSLKEPKQGRVHADCYADWKAANADLCPACKKPVLGSFYRTDAGKVHSEGDCYDKFRQMNADKCVSCGEAVLGSFYPVDEGKVHSEGDCYDKYAASKAPRCLACDRPVTGRFYDVDGGAVHAEGDCWDVYASK